MGEYMNKLYWYKCGVMYVCVLMHECDNVNMNMLYGCMYGYECRANSVSIRQVDIKVKVHMFY